MFVDDIQKNEIDKRDDKIDDLTTKLNNETKVRSDTELERDELSEQLVSKLQMINVIIFSGKSGETTEGTNTKCKNNNASVIFNLLYV